jgi:hypothetical protein
VAPAELLQASVILPVPAVAVRLVGAGGAADRVLVAQATAVPMMSQAVALAWQAVEFALVQLVTPAASLSSNKNCTRRAGAVPEVRAAPVS